LDTVIMKSAYIVLENLIAALEGRGTLVLLMVNSSEGLPLASTLDEGAAELLVRVILDRERVQRRDLGRALEVRNVDDGLYAADANGVGHRPVDHVDTLASELEDGEAIDSSPDGSHQFESASLSRDGALGDEDGPGNQEDVEKVPANLTVRCEVLDGSDGGAIVGV
jgi:hypothetical protein